MELENVVIRRFLRGLSGLILLAYTGYIIYRKLKFGAVNIDTTDVSVIGGCLAVLLAIEAVRYYVKKRLGISKDGKDAV